MDTLSHQIKTEIEATAEVVGLAPSTVGERIGQGGQFYARMVAGKRVWPETFDKVMRGLHDLRASVACDKSHGDNSGSEQVPAGLKTQAEAE